jgi:hypothetical protein
MRRRPIAAFVAAVVVVIGLGVGVLAATGDAALPNRSASGGPVKAGDACSSAAGLTSLTVTRVVGLPQNHTTFSFTTPIVVNDRAAVGAAARLLCDLPPMPSGAFSCPADFGTTYVFSFSASGGAQPQLRAVLDPDGCRTVTGLGRTRWTSEAPATFWGDLGRSIGLQGATNATFSGTMH